MKVITDQKEWRIALSKTVSHDIYHTSDYHGLTLSDSERACLFVFQGSSAEIFLPLIISQGQLEDNDFLDAGSVYGYAGPVTSSEEVGRADVHNFVLELGQLLLEMNVVSVFSRLHPLLSNSNLITGAGNCFAAGKTLSVNLSETPENQWGHYRKNLRRDIRKLRSSDIQCESTRTQTDLEAFCKIYRDTMSRLDADAHYFFSLEYFEKLVSANDFEMHLFVCKQEGIVICGGLFSVCNGVIQYHLGGTHADYSKIAPTKLLLDTVRLWGSERGLKTLHLGGGLGSVEDSLYRFKKGFSSQTHEFQLWNWIVDQGRYEELEQLRRQQLEREGKTFGDGNYFPSYRMPASLAKSVGEERA